MSLREYTRKRDFSKTAEPSAKTKAQEKQGTGIFVIQKHAARRLHYDLRLEIKGALASWAVPKGLPYAQGEKHLAVHVEDHPLDYARFEGIIPEGEYGGGTVMVWDIGHYEASGEADPKSGKIHFTLHGTKLEGEWTLVRTRSDDRGKENWLVMKTGKSVRAISRKADDTSALTGRTMAQITAPAAPAASPKKTTKKAAGPTPAFVAPMQPKLVGKLPKEAGWILELKFDGYRAIALKGGARVTLYSRNEKRLHFPTLADAIAKLPCERAILDGEIVALDPEGRPSFQLLQGRDMGEESDLCYYLFDLLQEDADDLRKRALTDRKARLASLIPRNDPLLRFSGDLPGTPDAVLESVRTRGLEGVVAKRADSLYEAGRRSGAWIKVKCILEQEFVIGGYTQPQRTRTHFGALLVGYYENNKLRFAGKVGGGFSQKLLEKLYADFQTLRTDTCPFVDISGAARETKLTSSELKRCTWLKPERVCEVKFTEWTREGKLRQPVFLGMRDDKAPREITREKPA